MGLSLGITGLPNVGKSTLFNALLKRQSALVADYPFTTIEPNIGVVDVPDARLEALATIIGKDKIKKIIPTTIEFYDIAGLVEGAAKGEGLGNQFLGHIRDVDVILHVVKMFGDIANPEDDIKIINTELILADIQVMEKRVGKQKKLIRTDPLVRNKKLMEMYKDVFEVLDNGKFASEALLNYGEKDQSQLKDLNLLTAKPVMYVFNIAESDLGKKVGQNMKIYDNSSVFLCARIESELSVLDEEDQKLYMKELKIAENGLDKVIQMGYSLLKLQTFFTNTETEVRAWTVEKGTKAPQAAGKVHTDFEKGFVKASVVSHKDLVSSGGFKQAQEKGLIRLEGKNYMVKNGDIIKFRFNV